eukprot:5347140-Alexandrium_andersonii.AAC.1
MRLGSFRRARPQMTSNFVPEAPEGCVLRQRFAQMPRPAKPAGGRAGGASRRGSGAPPEDL